GRPIQFDTWLDDLQLYLLSDSRDSVLLFDHTSGTAPAPPTTADSATRSQWLTRDAAARLAIRNHLPLAECAHFGQHRTAQALYDAVDARYSSPATAALGRLLLPFLFPELSAFATVEDLVSHLRTSDARYRVAAPAEFLDKNQPAMFITLYFLVTRLPDSLRSVRDHFLSLDPTVLIIDLLEQHILAAETSVVAVGAARGTPRTPFFERYSPSPLAPSYASAAAVDVLGDEDVGAASASAKRRSSKGMVGRGGGSGRRGGSGGTGSGGNGGGRTGAQHGGSGAGQRQQQQRRSETLSPQQLREWFAQRGVSGGSGSCPYVIRTGDRAGQTCGKPHTKHHCFSRLDDAWRAEFGDEAERPRWAELLRSGVAIFNLDYDVILAARYALSVSAEGDCYLCVLPDPGIEGAALGASESALPGTVPAEALHTFTLDSGATRCVFCDSTTLTPPSAPIPVRLADPSEVPVLARSSTVLPCPVVQFGSLSGLHLPSFSMNLVSTAALQDTMVTTTTPGGVHVRSGSTHLLMSPPVAPDSSVAPPPWSPLPATPWIRAVHLQLRERFRQDLHVLRLHSDRGGEFSSDLLREFCRGEGILQSFTLLDSPQQNGISERRIGLVMEVAHTSMIHAAAPHFLWPFAVRYAAHQLNLWPRVSLPETSPTLRWTGKVGDAPVFRFYHPTSRHVFPSQDVTFDELVPFYRLFPYRSAPPPPPTLFLAQGHPPIDPLAPSGVSQVDPLPSTVPNEVAVGSSAARGAASGSAASGDAEPGGTESENVGSGGVEPGGAESEGAEFRGAEPRGTTSGGPTGASPRLSPRPEPLSPQQLREWFSQRTHLWSGAAGAGDSATRDTRVGGAAVTAGARGTGGAVAAGPGGARTRGTGGAGTGAGAVGAAAGGTGAGGAGARGAGAFDPGAGGARGTVRPQPYFVPLLQQVLGVPSSNGRTPPLLCPPPDKSQPPLQPASPMTAPSPYTEQTGGLTERREPASRPTYPVRTGRCVPRLCPPPVPGTHAMAVRPSSVPLRVPLPAPLEPSLPAVSDLEFDGARATSPTVTRLLATAVTDPSFESTAASALIVELLDFAAA
ncbi:unnamed protein product, partial [Closterium sp. NIES-54]